MPLATDGLHCTNPSRNTLCGLPPPLSVMRSVPFPVTRAHCTVMVQDCPAPRLLGQLLFSENGPVMLMAVMLSALFAVFVSVKVCGREHKHSGPRGIKTSMQPNLKLFAERVTTVATPLSETVRGLPGALSAIKSIPLRLPETLGANVTFTVQLAPGATLDLQSSVSLKLAGAEMLVMLSGIVP